VPANKALAPRIDTTVNVRFFMEPSYLRFKMFRQNRSAESIADNMMLVA
jgi:hypothetical protein